MLPDVFKPIGSIDTPLAKDCLTSKSNRNLKEVLSLQSAGAEKRKDTRVSVFEDQDGECQKI